VQIPWSQTSSVSDPQLLRASFSVINLAERKRSTLFLLLLSVRFISTARRGRVCNAATKDRRLSNFVIQYVSCIADTYALCEIYSSLYTSSKKYFIVNRQQKRRMSVKIMPQIRSPAQIKLHGSQSRIANFEFETKKRRKKTRKKQT